MPKKKTDDEIAERNKNVVKMYKEGYPQREIARRLHIGHAGVQQALVSAGIRASKENRIRPEKYKTREEKEEDREQQGITPEKIVRIRKKIKVGSTLRIITEKSTYNEKDHSKDGQAKIATVIDTSNKHFCIVRLKASGVIDTVPWSDIYIAYVNKKSFVG